MVGGLNIEVFKHFFRLNNLGRTLYLLTLTTQLHCWSLATRKEEDPHAHCPPTAPAFQGEAGRKAPLSQEVGATTVPVHRCS